MQRCLCLAYTTPITDSALQSRTAVSQSVQNAAARLVTGSRRSDHITPVLRSLHWLPVRQRVTSKLTTLVHKCLNGQAPTYMDDFCRVSTDWRPSLRNEIITELETPRAAREIHIRRPTDHLLSHSQGQASGTACLLSLEIRHCPVKDSRDC